MIVLDASAAVLGLLNAGDARTAMSDDAIVCPHLADSEIVHALRGQAARGLISESAGEVAISTWSRLGIQRVSIGGLLDRIWELRHNLSAYDASYVAVAEALEVPLLTADGRLAAAPGPRCAVTVVRR